ncbi:Ferrous iron transport protein B homolog [Mesotoga infera]|uniref:Ferrous iron transport protein B n=1 Tax=Mesotoga infera TaxID=1236046 RepID=A0A7Z7LGB9_9BACT|nr:ferrous iron transport protein B [Mesotoga infera]SSC13365.1 Ferrous iron transport protein B homolog [Mesotoga infera]
MQPKSSADLKKTTVALLGNPNVGKTSIFNCLTGSKQIVANWPGVTVEKRVGSLKHGDIALDIVDLPGTYTLGSRSIDEKIARDFLIDERPNVVVVIGDAINLERSLYLLLQVLELRGDVVLVVNAVDEARKAGLEIDKNELGKQLGIPVVMTSAATGEGIEELKETLVKSVRSSSHIHYLFSEEIEQRIEALAGRFRLVPALSEFDSRWLAIKSLEHDSEVEKLTGFKVEKDFSSELAETRYRYIKRVLSTSVKGKEKHGWDLSEAIDHVITHRVLGIFVFLSVIYIVFQLTFTVSGPLSLLIESGLETLGSSLGNLIGPAWLRSLVVDGIIGGIGAILVFVPNIFILFMALGVLEESGYLPRAAFVIDRLMYSMKLSGRSFISMLLGFGCNVSSIMSTRSISEPKERIVTILVSPFISCSARLPVFLLIAGTFFGAKGGVVVFFLYLLSIIVTVISALIINRLLFKGEPSTMIMELPRYRKPRVSSIILYTWNKGRHFLEKAGTIILGASIVIWILSFFPSEGSQSYAAMIGRTLEPLFVPLGFSWEMISSLVFGVAAKEVIVSSLTTFYGNYALMGSAMEVMRAAISPVTAFSFLVFVLLYVPCLPTLAVTKNETGSYRYVFFSVIYSLAVAYSLALVVRMIGGLL